MKLIGSQLTLVRRELEVKQTERRAAGGASCIIAPKSHAVVNRVVYSSCQLKKMRHVFALV